MGSRGIKWPIYPEFMMIWNYAQKITPYDSPPLFQCKNNACKETYIGETKQPMPKRMYQHRRLSASGINGSSIYSYLNATQHSFEDKDIVILDKENKWFERGVKEAIYIRRETPSLNKGGASDITYQKHTT